MNEENTVGCDCDEDECCPECTAIDVPYIPEHIKVLNFLNEAMGENKTDHMENRERVAYLLQTRYWTLRIAFMHGQIMLLTKLSVNQRPIDEALLKTPEQLSERELFVSEKLIEIPKLLEIRELFIALVLNKEEDSIAAVNKNNELVIHHTFTEGI